MPKKNASTEEPVLRTKEIARMFGISLRQLQWWDERKIISPVQEGHSRLYSEQDAITVGIVSELRNKGLRLQAIRRVWSLTAKEIIRLLESPVVDLWLLVPGNPRQAPLIENDAKSVAVILAAQRGAMYVVSISDQRQKLIDARNGQHHARRTRARS
jgi:DNA-binding transcriptional MerR regulator